MKNIQNAVCQIILAGLGNQPQKLFEIKSPRKEVALLRKILNASENFQLSNATIYNAYGVSFCGIASWGKILCVRFNGCDHRVRILNLDRFGNRIVYSIPISKTDKLSALPGIDFSASELRIMLNIANELSSKVTEQLIEIRRPVRTNIRDQRLFWTSTQFSESVLLKLLESFPTLFEVAITAFDAQLRALKKMRQAPLGIVNFVFSDKSFESKEYLISVFQAFCFANETGRIRAGPIEIELKSPNDLSDWSLYAQRLVMLETSSGSLLRPLIEEIGEQERKLKCGGSIHRFLTLPISICHSALHSSQAIDISLPMKVPHLTSIQYDTLRCAMSKSLSVDIAQHVYTQWKLRASAPDAYRLNGLHVWRYLLGSELCCTWFSDPTLRSRAMSLVQKSTDQQRQEEQQREQLLQRAMDLLAAPAKYASAIVDRPKSKQAAQDILSDEAVAFRFEPRQGADHGKKLLAFTKLSLLRLLRRVDFQGDLLEAFLEQCQTSGILDQASRVIKLGDQTINAVTFSLET